MIYVEAPKMIDVSPSTLSLFIAGSISGAPNWQSTLIDQVKDLDIVIYNPRRSGVLLPSSEEKNQITWEHTMLRRASIISFWFAKETLAPITLYELGAWSMRDKPLIIGTHPEYERRADVEIQTLLVRPEITVFNNLEDVGRGIRRLVRFLNS